MNVKTEVTENIGFQYLGSKMVCDLLNGKLIKCLKLFIFSLCK